MDGRLYRINYVCFVVFETLINSPMTMQTYAYESA